MGGEVRADREPGGMGKRENEGIERDTWVDLS